MNYRKVEMIFCIVLFVLVLFAAIIFRYNKSKVKIEKELDTKDIIYKILEKAKQEITKKEIVFLENNIFIGDSKKQIENNFFDIKIYEKNSINIEILKLWKSIEDVGYINEQYIYELLDSVNIYDISNKELEEIKAEIVNAYNKYLLKETNDDIYFKKEINEKLEISAQKTEDKFVVIIKE